MNKHVSYSQYREAKMGNLLNKAVDKAKKAGYNALGGDEALEREIMEYKNNPEKYARSPLKGLVDKLLCQRGFTDENGEWYSDMDFDDEYDDFDDEYDNEDYDEFEGDMDEEEFTESCKSERIATRRASIMRARKLAEARRARRVERIIEARRAKKAERV